MTCLARLNIVKQTSILQLLTERLFKRRALGIVKKSKTNVKVTQAVANALSIWVRAAVPFNNMDLRGIRIPGADLCAGQFDSVDFEGAELSDVNMCRTWLSQANFSYPQMEGVQFGEMPFLEVGMHSKSCAFSSYKRLIT
jgi:uncharacterized protein YjbI with pentapeptide repeats